MLFAAPGTPPLSFFTLVNCTLYEKYPLVLENRICWRTSPRMLAPMSTDGLCGLRLSESDKLLDVIRVQVAPLLIEPYSSTSIGSRLGVSLAVYNRMADTI